MYHSHFIKICLLLYISTVSLSAQITINHPLNKAVYQRVGSGKANIQINGLLQQGLVSSVQARVVNPSSGLPLSGFDWSIISKNPIGGFFQGKLDSIPAGWHRLEVRAMLGPTVLQTANVPTFGIGDVFLIAGQSNGQGYIFNQYLGATDDRVVTHDNSQYCWNIEMPFPIMTKLLGTVKPSPNGRDAWCYGKLGDDLVAQTGFPVAFFNAGASGSGILNWKQSSDNKATIHPLTLAPFCSLPEENGGNAHTTKNPYLYFRKSLNYYNSMFGAKAVLWHQGESDNIINTSSQYYTDSLNYVINKSRADFGPNLSWVISRVSFDGNSTDANIIAGQNNTLSETNRVFAGPETDDLNNANPLFPNSRDNINLHFNAPLGLTELATRWKNSLNANFFNKATPTIANVIPEVSTSINVDGSINMTLPGSYTAYKWIKTNVNSNLSNNLEGFGFLKTDTTNKYRCWVAGSNGNLQISPEIDLNVFKTLVRNGASCSTDIFLSDLNPYAVSNGSGPVEINRTLGDVLDGDGVPITLKGVTYAKGLGVGPLSEIAYKLPVNKYFKFQAKLGISDDVSGCVNTGGVIFKVFGNGSLVYASPTVYRNSSLINIDLPISTYSDLKLRVEEVSNNTTCNKAVWTDTKLLCIAADVTPPTIPGAFTAVDTVTKCIGVTWTAATDNLAIKEYVLFRNGVEVGAVPATQLNYTYKNLMQATSYVLGIKAKDLNNNLSSLITFNISTKMLDVKYSEGEDYICSNRTYLPFIKTPTGGVFTLNGAYPGATLNYNTGAFSYTGTGLVEFYYTLNHPISGCEDFNLFQTGTVNAPPTTPVINADKSLINAGTVVNFTATPVCVGSNLSWEFTNSSASPLAFSPTFTGVYQASCRIADCKNLSNALNIKVVPNCFNGLSLLTLTDNLMSNPNNTLKFNSSSTLQATNTIVPTNRIEYNAANSIILNPGFTVNSGVNFIARIQNCPN